MTNQLKVIITECLECEEGQVYVDTSSNCSTYIGDCCGGCGYMTECEECEGSGEVEVPEGYTEKEFIEMNQN